MILTILTFHLNSKASDFLDDLERKFIHNHGHHPLV